MRAVLSALAVVFLLGCAIVAACNSLLPHPVREKEEKEITNPCEYPKSLNYLGECTFVEVNS